MRRIAAVLLSVVATATLTLGLASSASAATAPVTPVASVDLNRYAGQWYELASIPAIFEIQCAKNVKANYIRNADGTMGVTNSCTTYLTTTSSVKGVAKVTNAPANSALNVSFFNFFGRQVYAKDANYLIFGLDKSYRWALVGSADHKTGFVLSRTPSLPATDVATIKKTITANGFDVCSFKVTKQDGGARSRGALCSV